MSQKPHCTASIPGQRTEQLHLFDRRHIVETISNLARAAKLCGIALTTARVHRFRQDRSGDRGIALFPNFVKIIATRGRSRVDRANDRGQRTVRKHLGNCLLNRINSDFRRINLARTDYVDSAIGRRRV